MATIRKHCPCLRIQYGQDITKTENNMIHMNHNPQEFCAVNKIVGLSIDRLPSGAVMACEVRKDEAGELRVPIAKMSLDDLYALAARLHLEILPSKFATRQEMDSHRAHVRRLAERSNEARELRGVRGTPAWAVPDNS